MCTASWIHEKGGYELFFNRDKKLTRKKALTPRLASRGLVIPELIHSPSVAAMRELVGSSDCGGFAPFTLVALGRAEPAVLAEWDGLKKTVRVQDASNRMLTSSSFDTVAVRASRQEVFRGLLDSRGFVDGQILASFHAGHTPARSAYSVCMHRRQLYGDGDGEHIRREQDEQQSGDRNCVERVPDPAPLAGARIRGKNETRRAHLPCGNAAKGGFESHYGSSKRTPEKRW